METVLKVQRKHDALQGCPQSTTNLRAMVLLLIVMFAFVMLFLQVFASAFKLAMLLMALLFLCCC